MNLQFLFCISKRKKKKTFFPTWKVIFIEILFPHPQTYLKASKFLFHFSFVSVELPLRAQVTQFFELHCMCKCKTIPILKFHFFFIWCEIKSNWKMSLMEKRKKKNFVFVICTLVIVCELKEKIVQVWKLKWKHLGLSAVGHEPCTIFVLNELTHICITLVMSSLMWFNNKTKTPRKEKGIWINRRLLIQNFTTFPNNENELFWVCDFSVLRGHLLAKTSNYWFL